MKRINTPNKAEKDEAPSPRKRANLSKDELAQEKPRKALTLYATSKNLYSRFTNTKLIEDPEAENSSFEYDLETTPEYGNLIMQLDGLSIQEKEEGNEIQNKAIQLAIEGKNIFLTGKAGTGKSWVTRKLRSVFIEQKKNLYVTAPTGIAAIQSNGVTINSWGKFGRGEYYSDFDKMMNKAVRDKVCEADVLVIEEISMVNGHFFDVFECMIAIIRYYGDVRDRLSDIKREAGLDMDSKI